MKCPEALTKHLLSVILIIVLCVSPSNCQDETTVTISSTPPSADSSSSTGASSNATETATSGPSGMSPLPNASESSTNETNNLENTTVVDPLSNTTDASQNEATTTANTNTDKPIQTTAPTTSDSILEIPKAEVEMVQESSIVFYEENDAFDNSTELEVQEAIVEIIKDAYSGSDYVKSVVVDLDSISQTENGDIKVDYTVTFKLVSATGEKMSENDVEEIVKKANETFSIYNVTQSSLDEVLTATAQYLTASVEDACNVEDVCITDAYICVNGITDPIQCDHKCSALDPGCQNGGECVLSTNWEPICRCTTVGSIAYSGEKCDSSAEILALSKEMIIAIAAAAGGGLILILLITIIVLSRRDKNERKRAYVGDARKRTSEASFKSINNADNALREAELVTNNGMGNANHGYSNNIDSGVPYYQRRSNGHTSFSPDLSNGFELQEKSNRHSVLSYVESNPDYPVDKMTYHEIDDAGMPAMVYTGAPTSRNGAAPTSHIFDYDQRQSENRYY